jgi:hypothetical protein
MVLPIVVLLLEPHCSIGKTTDKSALWFLGNFASHADFANPNLVDGVSNLCRQN